MFEPQTIIETFLRLETSGERAVLATVVDVKGSSYRLPGARMLIDERGRSVGTISGGCLEADVLERAKRVLETGEPTVITYDTTRSDDSVFGLGMGCRGIVRILLETARGNQSLAFLRRCFERRKRGAAAILIDAPENFPLGVGAKFFDFSESTTPESGDSEIKSASGEISSEALKDEIWFQDLTGDLARMSAEKPANGAGAAKIYETKAGAVEFFLETVEPPVSLLLFGAGFDAPPVFRLAKNLGWRVTVIDYRAAFANRERFPEADEIVVARPADFSAELFTELFAESFADETAVAVLMTHNYERDREILPRLLASPVRYVGALGPKSRTEKMLAEIDGNFDARQLEKLHAPVGLDIGAETPEEIALAVVAEIQSVLTNRAGGFLRERRGGIHEKDKG